MSGYLLAERFEKPGSEAADDHQRVVLDRAAFVLRRLGDDPGVEGEQGGCSADIALQRFGHQRFDQSALLADAPRPPALAHRDLLAEFGGGGGREICAALWAALVFGRHAVL